MIGTFRVNGASRPCTGSSIAELLHSLGIDAKRPGIAVALNGRIVPRQRWPEQTISAGDAIDIVRPAQGG